jgi:6-phosphofructokinase 1
VLTSGGDAPGMNAAIRAATRMGLDRGWEVFGVRRGYAGLIKGEIGPLGPRDVGGIIQRGGTVLGSARSEDFRTEEGRARAVRQLEERGIDGVIVIGGNGSQAGAHQLAELGVRVVGVASTIDNDLPGSDITLGVDTALNIALEAVDRLKNTASSHGRAFLLEVMGRDSGYLALMTAIAGGAEAVVIPEVETGPEEVVAEIRAAHERGKAHAIIVVAEGARHDAAALVRWVHERQQELGFELRATTLGHVQRGGAPGAWDRILGTRLGAAAVERLEAGEHGVLVGLHGGAMEATPLDEVVGSTKPLDLELLRLAKVLARQ